MGVSRKAICLLSGNHLCHNPRVLKEATTLAHAGYDVEVLGAWLDPLLKARDRQLMSEIPFRFTPVIDFTESDAVAKFKKAVGRIRNKSGQLAFRYVGVPNRWQLGPAISALKNAARQRSADIFVAHSEVALVAAEDLLDSGRRIAVDMEDWFSEDLLPAARKNRPIQLLHDLERRLSLHGAYTTCPSVAMAAAMAREYNCPRPIVVYNAFRWSERKSLDRQLKDRRDRRVPSIHWYSQTLGEGRGLEDLLAALPAVDRVAEIHLRGVPDAGFDEWLADRTPEAWRGRVFVHGLVTNEELLSRIAEHDIGFAGEMKYCRSRDLTVTNKILQYLLAGLAVVASDTTGQREVASLAPDSVSLYPSGDASALAARLNVLVGSPESLRRARVAALQAAELTFCWERQEPVLVETVVRAVRA